MSTPLLGLALGLLLLSTLVPMVEPVRTIHEPIGRNHNEGWNAYHARAAAAGDDLYPPRDRPISNNYPPLSFSLIGRLGGPGGDLVFIGRWVSLLSLLLVAITSGVIAGWMARSRLAGAIAGLLALGTTAALHQNYVAMNDPQMLGHALQFLGLLVFLRGGRRGRLVAILPLLLGGLVKHNLVPLPLGLALWLLVDRRDEFLRWCLLATVLAAGGILALRLTHGVDFLNALLRHPRSYESHLLALALKRWLTPLTPLLAGVAAMALWPSPTSRVRPVLFAAGVAAVLSVASTLGTGMSINAFFDLTFLASILGGLLVHRVAVHPVAPRLAAPVLLLLLSLSIHLAAPLHFLRARERDVERPARWAATADDLVFMARRDGPAICEDPAVCYWAGKEYQVDFFNLSQKVRVGVNDGADLVLRIQRRDFSVLQLDRAGGSPFLPARVNRAIRENYRLSHTSPVNGSFYVPR